MSVDNGASSSTAKSVTNGAASALTAKRWYQTFSNETIPTGGNCNFANFVVDTDLTTGEDSAIVSSTGQFTAPRAGWYSFFLYVRRNNGVAPPGYARILLTGSVGFGTIDVVKDAWRGGTECLSGMARGYMSAGQTAVPLVCQTSGADMVFVSGRFEVTEEL